MTNILSQPYPFIRDWKYQIQAASWISVFVVLFLVLFQPFGLSNYYGENRYVKLAGYGFLTFCVLISVFALSRMVNPTPDEEKWTTGREILGQLGYIFILGIANNLYTHFAYGADITLASLASFQVYTLLVGVFPVTFFVLNNQARLMKRNLQAASSMNEDLSQKHHGKMQPAGLIRLTSENEKDTLEVAPSDLVLVESADNYCTVYYYSEGRIQNKLIRSSLKRIEAQVHHDHLVRCHRTYLVNLEKVISVSGNAQGYRLRFEGFDQGFPVSRSMSDTIRQKLHDLGERE